MREVQIVLLRDAWYTAHTRGACTCTKFSMRCDAGAEMNIFRRRTPAKAASLASVIYQEKRFFIIPTGVSIRHGSKSVYIPLTIRGACEFAGSRAAAVLTL